MRPNPQFTADLVTFTEKILNGKLHFLCSVKFLSGQNFWPFLTFFVLCTNFIIVVATYIFIKILFQANNLPGR